MSVQILVGDCRARLAEIESGSVNTCVTSPPYFGLRDYGHAGQIGLEPTPPEFVQAMVEVFREVRRVLRDDGTLWLNLGDSYTGSSAGQVSKRQASKTSDKLGADAVDALGRRVGVPAGLKPKELIGIPWRVAFALQADGWYLRQDIIWHKPNPMPESVTDRCTKAHEYVFLLSKGPRYYFDAAAIAERAERGDAGSVFDQGKTTKHQLGRAQIRSQRLAEQSVGRSGGALSGGTQKSTLGHDAQDTRNKRSVWMVPTQPFKEAHFATYPPALIEPCILAGAPAGGMVLDPFGGAGTTGLVADRLGRNATLIELNPEYAEMARRRIAGDAGMFGAVEVAA